MASLSFFSCSVLQYKNYHNITRKIDIHKPIYPSKSTSDIVTAKATAVVQPFARRSANYAPTLWTFDHIQSLSSEYTGEYYKARANSLKDTVKKMLVSKVGDPLSSLELVDDLQRLGISYHFQEEIRNLLEMIYCSYYKPHDQWDNLGLNLKALGFRLLRQHGFQVPQEIFHNFKSKIQNLKPQELLENTIGMLNLYEASYHSLEEESLLDDARDFSATFLKENQDRFDENISSLVSHALEFPLHWRVPRIEAKWFIHAYEKRSDMNPILLELSKLDFDMVQAVHIEDLKHASRWWSNTRWDSKLSFSRDRVVVNFLWTIGFGYLPQYTLGRRTLAKVNSMITTMLD
ncbi:putative R-linalool synthase [Helianthus annuus]|nr:putative R-linalool synthase [Helianthus annuus]